MNTDNEVLDYEPVERVVRTDFTAEELWNHLQSGDAMTISQKHQRNPNYDAEYEIWRQKVDTLDRTKDNWHEEWNRIRAEGLYPSYYIQENGEDKVYGEELVELEEFYYEAGYVHGFGTFKNIDNGNLGDGHEAWTLVQHKETGRYFRIGGWYSSWGDSGWDSCVEVEPAEVKVLRYKPLGAPDSKAFENPAVTVKD